MLATIPSVANPTVALVASPINRMGWLALCLRVFRLRFLHGIKQIHLFNVLFQCSLCLRGRGLSCEDTFWVGLGVPFLLFKFTLIRS